MELLQTLTNAIKGVGNFLTGKKDELPHDIPGREEGNELSIIGALEKQFEQAMNAKMTHERTWFLNIAAILGHQWVTWDSITRTYDPQLKIPEWRVRITDNKILKSYRKRLAKISNYNPKYVVTPNSMDTEDIEASRLGTKVVAGLQQDKVKWKLQRLDRTRRQLLCGNVFMTFGWDAAKGKKLPDIKQVPEQTQQPITTIESQEQIEQPKPTQPKTLYEGDVYTEVVSSFEIYCLAGNGHISNWTRMMRVKYVAISKARELAPTKEIASQIKPEGRNTSLTMYQDKIESLNNLNSGYAQQTDNIDGVYLKYAYERRSPEYPKGRFIAYANGVLLWDKDIPNIDLGDEFEFPYFQYQDIVIPDRTWGQATIEQQLPVNKELNKTESQLIEIKNQASKPKTVVAKGTVLKNAITSEVGEVVEVDMSKPGAFQPYQLPGASMPNYVIQIPTMLEKNLDDLGSTHEVSSAQTPRGVRSGTAIRALQEADNTDLGPVLLENSETDRSIFSALLKLVQEKYTEKRLLKIAGDDNMPEVFSFLGADLKGNTDVWMEEGDIVPMTRAERQLMIEDWYDMGLLGDKNNEETRKRALRLMEYGKVDEVYEEGSEDNKKARYENREMSKGIVIMPEVWENHEAELLEHLKAMKNPMYKTKDPKIRAMFEVHIQKHEYYLFPPTPQPPTQPKPQVLSTQIEQPINTGVT